MRDIDSLAIYSDEPKFGTMSHDDPYANEKVIRIWGESGVPDPPMQMERAAVILFLKTEYPNYTFEQLLKARTMAASGKLDSFIKNPDNLTMYSKPTVAYIGAIMSAYKAHATAENVKLKQIEEAIARETPDAKPDSRDLWENLVDFTRKNKEIITAYPWNAAYNYAKAAGIISLSEEEHAEILREVRKKAAGKNIGKFRILITPYIPTYEAGSPEEATIVENYKKEFALAEARYAEMESSIPAESLSKECKKLAVIKWLNNNIIKK